MKKVDGKYFYQRKPRRCPVCGGKAIATYYFGEPPEHIWEKAEKDHSIKIGGCCIEMSEYQRTWHCNNCGTDFYKKNDNWTKEWDE